MQNVQRHPTDGKWLAIWQRMVVEWSWNGRGWSWGWSWDGGGMVVAGRGTIYLKVEMSWTSFSGVIEEKPFCQHFA